MKKSFKPKQFVLVTLAAIGMVASSIQLNGAQSASEPQPEPSLSPWMLNVSSQYVPATTKRRDFDALKEEQIEAGKGWATEPAREMSMVSKYWLSVAMEQVGEVLKITRNLNGEDICMLEPQAGVSVSENELIKLFDMLDVLRKNPNFPPLVGFRIQGSNISDATLINILGEERYPEITTISLVNCRNITNEGLQPLRALKNLRELNLNGCWEITDEGLQAIEALTSLQSLNLSRCLRITDEGLQHLGALTNLRSLDLSRCEQITDVGLQHLAALTSLQSLNLRYCFGITDIEPLRALTSLQSLDLGKCQNVTDIGALRALTRLQSLDLSTCNITDIEPLGALTSLQSLDLRYCFGITDVGLQVLRALTSLQSLDLSGCSRITDAGLRVLAELTRLQSLDLSSCTNITDDRINNLRQALPSCNIER